MQQHFLSFLLILISIHICTPQETPIFVYNHFRHGARAPLTLNEDGTDYFGQQWQTQGELSGVGMRMEYILGYRNHLKYKSLLSETYDPRELYVYSSDVNRTIISAASQLQGLYPESTGPVLTDEELKYANMTPIITQQEIEDKIKALGNLALPHQINTIPIHVYHNDELRFLLHEEDVCLTMTSLMEKNGKESNTLKEIAEHFNKTYAEKLSKFIKGDEVDFTSMRFLNTLTDQFIADIYDGRDMSFLERDYDINVEQFLNDSMIIFTSFIEYFSYGDKDLDLVSMSMSPVFKEMTELMKNRVGGDIFGTNDDIAYSDYSKPKMVMISGHDTSTAASMMFMRKIFKLNHTFIAPVFTTNTMFEVYKNSTKPESYYDYIVKYYFNDQLLGTFNFAEFVDTISKELWTKEEIEDYCHLGKYKEREEQRKLKIATFVLGSLCGIALIVIIVIWGIMKMRKSKTNEPQLFNSKDDNLI